MKRMFTKALNLFSVLLLLVAIGFSFFAVAQPNEASAAWDGTVATSFSSGSGTAASPYVISSESQLGYFMAQLASGVTYDGQYIQLSKSLNMTGSIWDTSHYTAFGGTFDGQGYTITADCPFMTVIGETGVVQGLNYNTYHIQLGRALICDTNNGVIRSCTAYGDVYATSGSPVYGGMICTKNTGTVENCGAIGALYASGDDTSAYAAMVPQNTGTVTGCYSAITVKALGTGKYSDEEYCPVSHRGIATNSFYDKTLHPYTAHCGEGLTTAELQSDAFLTSLQGTSVSGTRWVKGSHGYPELAHCSTSYAYVSGYQGNTAPIIYSGTSKTITLYSSSTSSNIYYTLDGTDPTTSSTRKTLYSGYTMSISGDTVLTMAPYYSGTYGTVTRQTFINLQGSGTAANPYKITTKRQLDAIRMLPDKIFALKNDLTFTDADFTLGGIAAGGWTPIPNFSGKLDGEGHAITGLRSNHGGLFNDVETGATVTSLRLMDHKLCSPGDFGAIAKHNYGTITRCYVKSAFTVANAPSGKEPNSGFPYIGGVVAFNRGTVSYCRNDGLTVGLGVARYGQVYMGGIAGSNQGTLESCVNFGGILLRNNAHADNGYFGGITGTGDVYEANCRSRCDMTLQNSFDYSVVCTGMSGEDPYLASVASLCIADPFTVSWSIPTSYSVPTTNKYAISGIARDSYTLQDRAIAESYPKLDFTSDWMFTQEGPMPQGVMDADGHCLRTSAYIVPSCTKTGSVTLYCELCSHVETQTLDKIPHNYSAYVSDGNATCLEDGTKTRTCTDCGLTDTIADEGSALGHTYANGFCVRCDAVESAADKNNDGIWEIGNAGQLYWFAELVKDGQTTASAVLTENITVNSGVLTADGALNSGSFRSWNPIGHYDYMYEGTFDGCGHTVSGLYMNARAKYCALFGYVGEGGTVRNLGLTDSYIKGDMVIGGIAASCSGLIENCFNTATVIGINEIGGISGSLFNSGVIRSCYNAGRIQDTGSAVDIAGIVSYVNSSATVENCFYLDSSETDHYDGTTAMNADRFASGEVAWKLNGDQSNIRFRQTCGQGLPAFTGSQVYRNQIGGCTTNAEYRYSNTQEEPVLVHTFTVYTGNGDATCLEDGTQTAICDFCDATDTIAQESTALGHSFTHYISDGNEGCYMDGSETAKCDRCDVTDTRTEAGSAGHLFTNYISNNNATCIHPGTKTAKCDRCDVKDTQVETGSEKGHSFTNYVSNGDATCLTDGTKTAKCDRCTVTKTLPDEGSALGHSFTNYISDGNVTCTEDGTQTAKCDRCDVTDTIVLEALGHDMSDWFTVTEPSCTASGLEQSDCARCDHSETRIIPILPHSFEGAVTEPTCTEQGYTTYTCHCGESYVSDKMPVLGHSFTDYVSDGNATCTADGTQTAKCDRCDVTDTTTLKALGHSFTNYTSIGNATCTADGLKIATCDRCPEMNYAVDAGSMLGHSFTQYVSNDDATCLENGTETAKCDRCDETDTREDEDSALGHDLAAWYTVTESTCTEEGLERADCSRCDHSETLPIPATGHSYTEEIIDPTCTEGGSTVHRCHCGDSYEDSYSEMLGHSFTQYVSDNNATCTENGTETAKCDRCEETHTREDEASALGHDMGQWYTVSETSCTEDGVQRRDCIRCEYSETRTVSANGHPDGGPVVTENVVPATCTQDGSYDRVVYCPVCQEELSRDTYVDSANGHKYGSWMTEPTCTEGGYTTHTCSGCGDTYVDSLTEATGHSFVDYTANGDASCTADGTETGTCHVCGATDTRTAEGSALGHEMSGWYTVTEATCTEEGLKQTDCVRCDHSETSGIPATGHHYEAQVTEPTCTEGGFTTHTCHCGNSYVDGRTEKLGHSFTQYVSNGDATCTEDGTETAKCDRCEETDTHPLAGSSPGHNMGQWYTATEASCTEEGLKRSDCSRCDHFEAERIPVAAHSYDEVILTPPTCTEDGYTTHTCHCGDNYVDSYTEALGHTCNEWIPDETFDWETGECTRCHEVVSREFPHPSGSFDFGLTWRFNEKNGILTVSGNGYMEYFDSATEQPWYEYSDLITGLVVKEGVRSLGENAFAQCYNLVSVTLPQGLEQIQTSVFQDCLSLISITIPETVTHVGEHAFEGCSKLQEIVLPEGISEVSPFLFANCTGLKKVTLPNTVTRIAYDAFINCKALTEITIPDGVTEIGDNAFQNCTSLTSIQLPDSVTTLGDSLFSGCTSLVSAKLPANIRVISWCMFQSCSSLESFVIPNRVSVIESSAFSDCTSLVSVEIPESVIRIDSSAFAYCTSLTSVKLPGRLTTIANQVFSCAGLTSVEIPASVTTIEDYAFGTCRELSEIYFMGDPCEIQQTAFTEVTATAYYPSENTAWTEDMLQNYGGNLTWKPCCYNGHTEIQDTPIAPSCEEAGYANGTHCSVCSEIMDTPEIIPALGHSFTQYVSNGDATCTDEGTETAKCDRCDVVDTRLVENSNLGHDLKDWNILTMPTCVEEGLEESICSRCGHSETRILPATGIHDYSETILTLPTCTEQGYTTHICCYCGNSYDDNYTETVDHSFSHYVSDGNATCTEDGTKTAKCDWCDETDTVTDVGSVDGHWLIDCWQVVIKPTCTTEGLETATCAKCGVYQESHEIPIIEHSYEATVTEPTCTKQGYTTHTCRYCGDSYKNTYVDATGHDFGKWYTSKDVERRDCENCDHYETRALPNQKPDAPVLSITGNTTTGKPKISWKAIDGAGKYQIYRSTKKTSGFKYLKSTKTATSFTDTSAEAGVTYYYKVKAYHAVSGLSSDWSNTVSRVCDLAKPTVSISIKTATGQPVVKWETVEGAAKYQVYRSEKKSSGYKLVYTGVTARSYTDKTAKPGITYYYKVKAVHTNSSADSAYSAVVSQVCDLAKPVVTIKLSSGDPRLTWKKIPGAAKYRVYRSSTKDGEYKLVKTTVSATSFTDKEAKAGKTWYYKVRAIHENSSANSAYSSIVSIKAK